ncbi:MAG: YqjK-like family protein [Burkholderiales bacterium]|nr:YqjK-like family protein [Burkholderiales bacterium]
MSVELERIAERRRWLVSQAAAQRFVLEQEMTQWKPRLALADRSIAVYRYFRRYPALLAGAGVVAVLLRPRLGGVWMHRGLMLWQICSQLRRIWRHTDPKSGN